VAGPDRPCPELSGVCSFRDPAEARQAPAGLTSRARWPRGLTSRPSLRPVRRSWNLIPSPDQVWAWRLRPHLALCPATCAPLQGGRRHRDSASAEPAGGPSTTNADGPPASPASNAPSRAVSSSRPTSRSTSPPPITTACVPFGRIRIDRAQAGVPLRWRFGACAPVRGRTPQMAHSPSPITNASRRLWQSSFAVIPSPRQRP
jgi:hypothetical protein